MDYYCIMNPKLKTLGGWLFMSPHAGGGGNIVSATLQAEQLGYKRGRADTECSHSYSYRQSTLTFARPAGLPVAKHSCCYCRTAEPRRVRVCRH